MSTWVDASLVRSAATARLVSWRRFPLTTFAPATALGAKPDHNDGINSCADITLRIGRSDGHLLAAILNL